MQKITSVMAATAVVLMMMVSNASALQQSNSENVKQVVKKRCTCKDCDNPQCAAKLKESSLCDCKKGKSSKKSDTLKKCGSGK